MLTKLKKIFFISFIVRKIKIISCLGLSFKCCICGWVFRKLLPVIPTNRPNANRPNATCPVCSSRERHRLLWLFLRQKTNFFDSGLKVLHFAPEPFLSKILKSLPKLHYISVDLSSKISDALMDITSLAVADEVFDFVLCSHVLEHVVNDRKAMREIFRVLSPGGRAIVQVPIFDGNTYEDNLVTSPEDREHVFGQSDHVRKYGIDLKGRLEEAGFNVQMVDFGAILGTAEIRRHCLIPGDYIFYCSKPV